MFATNRGADTNSARSKSKIASSTAARRIFFPVAIQTAAAISKIAVEYAHSGRPGLQGGPGTGPAKKEWTRN